MDFKPFLSQHLLPEAYLAGALKWFKPLGDAIALHHDSANSTYFVGVNGAQGSGKSTLAEFLAYYLTHFKSKNCAVMSLDDFYLSQSDRLSLSVKVHPLLKTRGVPGTHNVGLIEKTLNRLCEYGTVSIPQFDKATDNPKPVTEWPVVNSPIDIVIFEGWCWGISPQSDSQLIEPVNALEEQHDALGNWRDYVNRQIAKQYQKVQEKMNYWVMLQAPSFECVEAWRIEQEHKLKIKQKDSQGSAIMTDQQIRSFIMYFQRLTQHCLATLPDKADCVFELDKERHIMATKADIF